MNINPTSNSQQKAQAAAEAREKYLRMMHQTKAHTGYKVRNQIIKTEPTVMDKQIAAAQAREKYLKLIHEGRYYKKDKTVQFIDLGHKDSDNIEQAKRRAATEAREKYLKLLREGKVRLVISTKQNNHYKNPYTNRLLILLESLGGNKEYMTAIRNNTNLEVLDLKPEPEMAKIRPKNSVHSVSNVPEDKNSRKYYCEICNLKLGLIERLVGRKRCQRHRLN